MSKWQPDFILLRGREGYGHCAIIDHEDTAAVLGHSHKWYVRRKRTGGVVGPAYVRAGLSREGMGQTYISLHKIVLGETPDGAVVDHVNRDPLDNRRENLRFVDRARSNQNRGKFHDAEASIYIGVSKKRISKKWVAAIVTDYKPTYLGSFSTPEDAARAYDREAFARRGEFAVLNFPDEVQNPIH